MSTSTRMFSVLEPGRSFRGRTLGEWVAEWTNWLVSEDPFNQTGPVRFARGSTYSKDGKYAENDGTGNNGLIIDTSMALLIPVITSTADNHFYSALRTEADLRNDVRGDIALTSYDTLYADYQTNGGEWTPILPEKNFSDHIVETPLFKLNIEASTRALSAPRVWDDVQLTEAFTADAVTVGIILLLTFEGDVAARVDAIKYKFRFGGVGDSPFYTNSTYDVLVNQLPGTHAPGLLKLPKPITSLFRGPTAHPENEESDKRGNLQSLHKKV
ncbi:MAG TPA: hypothetical protein VFI73_10640 [Candidatus Nitrosopolaris sp.]|nr:hypothetical protein [Candidatus Nitrosopolaris sp.]